MFDIYINTKKYISDKTAKPYSKIISRFIIFSPSVDLDHIDNVIESTINL